MDDKKQTQIPVGRSQVKRMRELFKLGPTKPERG